jgi:hypothetical protein
MEKKAVNFDGFVRMELGKVNDRLEKLEQGLESLRKLVKKISETLTSGKSGGLAPMTIATPAGSDVTRDEFNKLA